MPPFVLGVLFIPFFNVLSGNFLSFYISLYLVAVPAFWILIDLNILAVGLRIFDQGIRSTDATESGAFSYRTDVIDIYSNSWGPGDIGWQVQGPGVLAGKAIEHGIQKVSIGFFQQSVTLSTFSKHEKSRFITPCRRTQDSLGFWVPRRGFRIFRYWLPVFVSGTWILECNP